MSDSVRPDTAERGTPITPEWQRWVAQNVLRGVPADRILRSMGESGFNEATAAGEVSAAMAHPYLQAAAELTISDQPPAAADTAASRADQYAWILEVTRRAAQLSPSFGSVPRLTNPSSEAFLEGYYAQNRPCVIQGAMDDWAALTKWDPEYLKAGRSDKTVAVEIFRDADGGTQAIPARVGHEMLFGEFVDAVENGATNGLYMTAGTTEANLEVLEGLWGDIAYPEYLDPNHALGKGLFWYGPAGTFTPIHHDLTNNLMAQVRGRKRVKLIAPYESADVYNEKNDRYSPVDIERPDLTKHPNMARVTIMDVEIGPGEMLFVPAGWWHGVRSLDTSITFTFMNFVYETDFYSFLGPQA